MPEFTVRADSVDVEQIMEQIRTRIREKRGVDYTEEQIRELATVKLEKFLDARGVRSDLIDQFKRMQTEQLLHTPDLRGPILPPLPGYEFGAETLYATHRAPLRLIRRLLQPVLKLFFNPNSLVHALHLQSQLNAAQVERAEAEKKWQGERQRELDQLRFEVLHNLVMETTRLGIEVKNLRMRVESLTGRLEFNERRARALESVVVYQADVRGEDETSPRPLGATATGAKDVPGSTAEGQASELHQRPPGAGQSPEGPGQRSRRRRRRGRRGGGAVAAVMGGSASEGEGATSATRESAASEIGDSAASSTGAAASGSERRESPTKVVGDASGREASPPAESVSDDRTSSPSDPDRQ